METDPILELTKRLEKLEIASASHPSMDLASSSRVRKIFTPCATSLDTQILKMAPQTEMREENTKEIAKSIKLPNLDAPIFEGTNLESFFKRLERFFRLCGVQDETQKKIFW